MGLAASKQEAFWEACGFGDKLKVRKYIAEGIDVNWVSYTHNSCAIHVASQGKIEIVQMLLDAKCNIDAKDDRGNLALHHAAMKGHADIIELLIKAGSDINCQDKNGWTPLINAAYFCQLDAVKMLLKYNCSVTIQNQDMRSALHEACRSPSTNEDELEQIVLLLIGAGSDINSKSSDKGEADFTPLMFCAYHGHPKVAQVLLQAGCDFNSQGSNLWTALHWAADRNHLEVVKVLVYAGADVLIKGIRGELALDRATWKEVYSFLYKAVEDASYNFDDPVRDVQSRLRDISCRIFETADAHRDMVDKQLQMLEDEDLSNAITASTLSPSTDNEEEVGDARGNLANFDPDMKSSKRDVTARHASNSANRLSLILNNSISPFNSPPPKKDPENNNDDTVNNNSNNSSNRSHYMSNNYNNNINNIRQHDDEDGYIKNADYMANGFSGNFGNSTKKVNQPLKFMCDDSPEIHRKVLENGNSAGFHFNGAGNIKNGYIK